MPATWEEMQDMGYVVHSPTTGRIMPTQKGLTGIGGRLKGALGLRGGGLRSGEFAGYQGSVQTRDPYGSPQPMSAMNNDLAALAGSFRNPRDVAGLGMLEVNLNGQQLRGLSGIDQERAGRICAATSAIGQMTTAIGSAIQQSQTAATSGTKDPVKGQGTADGWTTANTIAGQTDELCSAMFAQSGATPPADPFAVPGGTALAPPVAAQPGGFGSDSNKMLLYGAGAVALVGVLFLLKD